MSDSPSISKAAGDLLPSTEQRARLRRRRAIKDNVSRYGIGMAGIGVVGALTLIFVYLFSEAVPMLKSASADVEMTYEVPGASAMDPLVHLTLERYGEIGTSFSQSGLVTFFGTQSQLPIKQAEMPRPENSATTAVGISEARRRIVAYGYDTGQVAVGQLDYEISYPDDVRHIEPVLRFPLGEELIQLAPEGEALQAVEVQEGARATYVIGASAGGNLYLKSVTTRENIMTGEVQVQSRDHPVPAIDGEVTALLVNDRFDHLYVADDLGMLHMFDIRDTNNIRLVESHRVSPEGYITDMKFLIGTVSLVIGTSDGTVSQWFPIRDAENNFYLQRIRDFRTYPGAVTRVSPEYFRKGFLIGDDQGNLGIHHGTAHTNLLFKSVSDRPIREVAISPRNQMALVVDADYQLSVLSVWNRHPETSWRSLWTRVWYEGRSSPEFVWQSSSASDEFEPKMSLIPLSMGTLKAAFYAMLFAIPLALMGAIYTAYFMPPKTRALVKPSIEIMEALPTVILGFLAGLWLAPFLENHLPAVFSILILLPLGMLAFGFAWSRLPAAYRGWIPEGWEAVALVPVILFIGWACVTASPWVEVAFFDGSMRQWFTDNGITYDQRNAMVVGMAMGFAVIPTIFSIAEDAVYSVPKHLTQGSLALGATRWQTVVGVVLPTASPGMFSAVMMGFGRAVGETMIVLMATGNSPVTNWNIFEGMRTLSANIAVELPETAVGSTHFRVLFLAALVLFVLTFIVNTLAEVIRQRLRKRYSNL